MDKILVANRGEIARRVFRTCRAMGIATVAVFTEPDRDAPFVREADESVGLGDVRGYLDIERIIAAARATGAGAIHPGYGFLSENAAFAARCREAGLVFIGPPADAIAAMGSKVEARRRMEEAGVPVLPGFDLVDPDPAALIGAAEQVGFPLLVKASAGGGGKGMRTVRLPGDLAEAVEGARREAVAAFDDGALYLERYLEPARHIEVQVFGDTHGTVVHLNERECSIQRRHQKIIEESPSPAVDEGLRDRLGAAAVTAAAAIGYRGAGTVEFLVGEGGDFYFLEMNTRLQVEHPVTEAVTGLDLVEWQIRVARGEAIPDQAAVPGPRGHAIEARLYAEDAARGFLPTTGTVHRFEIPEAPGIRVDSGVESGSEVGVHYDPMLAKVVAWGPDRPTAAARLAAALATARLHGIVTNRNVLVRILRNHEFLAGDTDTGFLQRFPPERLGASLVDRHGETLHAVAAALAAGRRARARAAVLGFVPPGWRNLAAGMQLRSYETPAGQLDVEYRVDHPGTVIRVNGVDVEVVVHEAGPDLVDMEADGVRRRYRIEHLPGRSYVDSPLGFTELAEFERFSTAAEPAPEGSLAAPMPGTIVEVRVRPDDLVEAGDVLLVMEAMKMEHRVTAPARGRVVEVRAAPGARVDAGTVLAVIEAQPGEEDHD